MKLCKDCKYAEVQGFVFKTVGIYSRCLNPDVNRENAEFLVNGKRGGLCQNVRHSDECGFDGKRWEAK